MNHRASTGPAPVSSRIQDLLREEEEASKRREELLRSKLTQSERENNVLREQHRDSTELNEDLMRRIEEIHLTSSRERSTEDARMREENVELRKENEELKKKCAEQLKIREELGEDARFNRQEHRRIFLQFQERGEEVRRLKRELEEVEGDKQNVTTLREENRKLKARIASIARATQV